MTYRPGLFNVAEADLRLKIASRYAGKSPAEVLARWKIAKWWASYLVNNFSIAEMEEVGIDIRDIHESHK